jgi:Cu/Ag efflux pump CusA
MIFGGGLHRVEVRVRPEALFARHLTLADVTVAVRAATAIRGGGYVDTPSQHILIEPDDQNFSAALLSQAVVSSSAGTPLRLADIADVADATVPAFGQALVMGRPGLVISMTSQYGSNTLEVTSAVEQALAELHPLLQAQGVQVYPALHRPANFIENAVPGVAEALFARHLTLADVTVAVRAATAIRGGGCVDTPSQHILIDPAQNKTERRTSIFVQTQRRPRAIVAARLRQTGRSTRGDRGGGTGDARELLLFWRRTPANFSRAPFRHARERPSRRVV